MQGDFFLTTWFLEAMKWVYSNVNSVFLTILICTVVLRGITIFSDIATRKSQAKMNGIQPELAKIQKNTPMTPEGPDDEPKAHEGEGRLHVGKLPAAAHNHAAVFLLYSRLPLLGL